MSIKAYHEGIFLELLMENSVPLLKWLLESMLDFFELYFMHIVLYDKSGKKTHYMSSVHDFCDRQMILRSKERGDFIGKYTKAD